MFSVFTLAGLISLWLHSTTVVSLFLLLQSVVEPLCISVHLNALSCDVEKQGRQAQFDEILRGMRMYTFSPIY